MSALYASSDILFLFKQSFTPPTTPGAQQSLPIARYSCSLAFTTISGDYSVVIVHGDLSGLGIRPLYTFSFSGRLGGIDLHALPTHVPSVEALFNIQLPPLRPPELGAGIGFRITVGPGRYIERPEPCHRRGYESVSTV